MSVQNSLQQKHVWWKEAVVYQIYPRSFQDSDGDGIGDLCGICSRLEYLKKLGIDIIWLSPVYQSPNADNGYDISNYQAIMKEFGTMEDFDELLQRAHEFGIRIMMDLVVNHSSDEHAWFVESRKSTDNPFREYYIWKKGRGDQKSPNNWGACFGGSAWKYDQATDMYYLHLFTEKQPDLNWDYAELRHAVYDMMNWWCDKGIDGFRMDVISMISKDPVFPDGETGDSEYADGSPFYVNGPHVHEYLQEMNREVLSGHDLITVGEAAGVTVEEAARYAGESRNELNMVFQFEHIGESIYLGEKYGKWDRPKLPVPMFREIMTKWQTRLEDNAWNSLFLSNHDQPRCVSRFGNDTSQYRVLSAKMLATCIHMMRGTPYIYQGEELGMTNAAWDNLDDYRDIESLNAYRDLTEKHGVSHKQTMEYLKKISRDNARTPMQWNCSPEAGFTTGKPWINVNPNYIEINAENELNDEKSVFYYYQELIRLRHSMDIIVYGDYVLLENESDELMAYSRNLGNQTLVVICNFSDRTIFLPDTVWNTVRRAGSLLISNYQKHDSQTMQPYEAAVYVSG